MSDLDRSSRAGPALWEAPPPKWDSDAGETLICRHVRQETHDVKTFVFAARTPRLFRFKPGQFVTFEFNIGGTAINRCYTMASAPTRPDTFSITVKRKAGGTVSNWLHDTLRPGSEVQALGPAGAFTTALHPAEKYLFLSGGSGITPVMSMARTYYDLGEDRDIVFVHSARTPRDIIFRSELAVMSAGTQNFRTAFICEQAGDAADWTGPLGQLTLPVLQTLAPDFAGREIFCCGPEPYMAAVRGMLRDAGFAMAHYHEESFAFDQPAAEPIAVAASSPAADGAGFKIEFTKSGQTVHCAPGQFILDAAKAAGMRLPFSCSKGMCGTCKTKKLSGDVAMEHNGGIRKREIDAGMILPCCSKPLSDVMLER